VLRGKGRKNLCGGAYQRNVSKKKLLGRARAQINIVLRII
jgi:hypothetical protein